MKKTKNKTGSEQTDVKTPAVAQKVVKKMRQIIIETDGDSIKLVKAEVNGRIELLGIFQNLINYISTNKK